MKVAVPLAKNILVLLGITAAASAIQKKIHGSGTTTVIILTKEMNNIMKIVQALDNSNILLKGVTKTIENETKEQKVGFICILLSTLEVSLLGNLLTGKGAVRAVEGIVRAAYDSSMKNSPNFTTFFNKLINKRLLRK